MDCHSRICILKILIRSMIIGFEYHTRTNHRRIMSIWQVYIIQIICTPSLISAVYMVCRCMYIDLYRHTLKLLLGLSMFCHARNKSIIYVISRSFYPLDTAEACRCVIGNCRASLTPTDIILYICTCGEIGWGFRVKMGIMSFLGDMNDDNICPC